MLLALNSGRGGDMKGPATKPSSIHPARTFVKAGPWALAELAFLMRPPLNWLAWKDGAPVVRFLMVVSASSLWWMVNWFLAFDASFLRTGMLILVAGLVGSFLEGKSDQMDSGAFFEKIHRVPFCCFFWAWGVWGGPKLNGFLAQPSPMDQLSGRPSRHLVTVQPEDLKKTIFCCYHVEWCEKIKVFADCKFYLGA